MAERGTSLPREAIVRASISGRGALILVRDLDEACAVSNHIAPEPLELAVDVPRALIPQLRHARDIFVGRTPPEASGGYCAGPKHVLPHPRPTRFPTPPRVYESQKTRDLTHATAK